MMRVCGLTLLAFPALLLAAETAGDAQGKANNGKKVPKSLALQMLAEEEKWEFRAPPVRVDPFYDREAVIAVDLIIASRPSEVVPGVQPGTAQQGDQRAELLAMAAAEAIRIESMITARKYEEAVRSCEGVIKRLERFADDAAIAKAIARMKVYLDQATEAMIRAEAQAAFDKLNLVIQGIMWAEAGSRLAIIAGEARAVGVNDRAKDCVIINIDTDRVDFRYHYKGRRFEFPRYVGEDGSASK